MEQSEHSGAKGCFHSQGRDGRWGPPTGDSRARLTQYLRPGFLALTSVLSTREHKAEYITMLGSPRRQGQTDGQTKQVIHFKGGGKSKAE